MTEGFFAGLPYEIVLGADGEHRVRFKVKDQWTPDESINVSGFVNSQAIRYMLVVAREKALLVEDFKPWLLESKGFHFPIWVNGEQCAAKVSRDCLTDQELHDDRQRFAASEKAEKLRAIALGKLAAKKKAFITQEDLSK